MPTKVGRLCRSLDINFSNTMPPNTGAAINNKWVIWTLWPNKIPDVSRFHGQVPCWQQDKSRVS